MRKIFIAFALLLCSLTAMAQPLSRYKQKEHRLNAIEQMAAKNSYRYQLNEIYSDDRFSSCSFFYNERNQLVAVSEVEQGGFSVIDSLFYNEQGQMVRLAGWQLLDGSWKNVYYIDYTYDAAGNIASRTNYNDFDGVWQLGGVYAYSYNADNQIVLTTLTMSGVQYQKVEYSYEGGRLFEELWFSYNGSGLSPDEKLTYRYDAEGRTQEVADSLYEGSGSWQFNGRQTYVYDPQGNCTEFHRYDVSGQESERSEYLFDEQMTLDETLMPWSPEMSRPKTYSNTRVYTTERWYGLDTEHRLQHFCDYIYSYGNRTLAISEVAQYGNLTFCPNPAESRVSVDGLTSEMARLQVIDLMGRVVLTGTVSSASNSFSVASLASGCYRVCVVQHGQLRTGSLIVK